MRKKNVPPLFCACCGVKIAQVLRSMTSGIRAFQCVKCGNVLQRPSATDLFAMPKDPEAFRTEVRKTWLQSGPDSFLCIATGKIGGRVYLADIESGPCGLVMQELIRQANEGKLPNLGVQ